MSSFKIWGIQNDEVSYSDCLDNGNMLSGMWLMFSRKHTAYNFKMQHVLQKHWYPASWQNGFITLRRQHSKTMLNQDELTWNT